MVWHTFFTTRDSVLAGGRKSNFMLAYRSPVDRWRTRCEHRCCLDCGENGRCNLLDKIAVCECRARYVGDSCETRLPEPVKDVVEKENTWYMWVVGACVGTFVMLLIGTVVTLYYMWRHRVVLVMKIVHYFQAYEEDDQKKWDAFVSYRSHPTEEDFVLNTLYPKLEKELGFTLCLHFRDFVPGETISNNIINAVDGSRRTILILTPRYIESEFTRFEYEKAQQEMMKRKHRIIPIVLEDISRLSSIMDKSLKAIISAVTYLEWPMESDSKKIDKFWKRLQLSLPKKKVADTEPTNCRLYNTSGKPFEDV
ncbi:interleukin-1 receptor accessory protein-like [Dreissena polymorpha]|uniref:interleukin-1 receptor accessory protein-like n=1 Tax=Dreissena polymorpha TaxID=45954 RepID=UPI002263EFC0|nr:interleukin-1 receptor accessory protein-like [Dreissena polymorpha]